MALKSEAIAAYLKAKTHPDLAAMYHPGMEVQVIVSQGNGIRIDTGTLHGKTSFSFSDGIETWGAFRIPRKAMSEPEDNDGPINWNFEKHVEGIGMTGWDWKEKVSRWVAFDFDAMIGHSDKHSKKLTAEQMEEVHNVVTGLPYVTVRRSTSGKGLHVYIMLEPFPTNNHTEHAALARSILNYMAGITGFNFSDKVDVCGGNTWVWHRKMLGTNGLSLIKSGNIYTNAMVPANWRDHLNVIARKTTRTVPKFGGDNFSELSGQRTKTKLDEDHLKLIKWLTDRNYPGWWDGDNHMLVTHTFYLEKAHRELGMKGEFHTISTGKEEGSDLNCFSGDTEIITKTGVTTLKEAAKVGYAELLVWDGKTWIWKNSRVRSFGYNKTRTVLFGNGTSVRATNNHEWLHRLCGRVQTYNKKTYELVEGKTELPIAQRMLPIPDRRGIAHGFVYGDGNNYTKTKSNPTNRPCEVVVFGEKKSLVPLLCEFGKLGHRLDDPRVYEFPSDWKELPHNPTPEYALGFILGLVAADGFVHPGLCSIQQSGSKETVAEIWRLAVHAGLYCHKIGHRSVGAYSNAQPAWGFYFSTYNMSADLFIRADHKRNFSVNKKSQCTTVSLLGRLSDEEEEVFCAEVDFYHNFTLANGVTTSNCFGFPCRNGSWAIRRYGQGTKEHPIWTQDGKSWTKCFFNRELTLDDVCRLAGAVETENGCYQFANCTVAKDALLKLGIDLTFAVFAAQRPLRIKEREHKISVSVPYCQGDAEDKMVGWLREKTQFVRVFANPRHGVENDSANLGDYDDCIRHVVSENGEDCGWVMCADSGVWRQEPINHVKLLMKSKGIGGKDVDIILGQAISAPWIIVNQPFQPEYPGDRRWNRSTARFRIAPTLDGEALSYPTWMKVLNHCGNSLTSYIQNHAWCKANGITSGGEYLRLWFASLIQHPQKPLPYLAFYGPQDSGKSTIHEAFCQLILDGGYMDGALALVSQGGFNGELQDSILCTLEEVDLRQKAVIAKMKDWVTSTQISIHVKGQTPYKAPNYTHWIQCVNDRDFIPVFPGDTRVVVSYVDSIPDEVKIPKRELWTLLTKEAPDYLAGLISTDIPDSHDRLMLPVVRTGDKDAAEFSAMDDVGRFFTEKVKRVPGALVKQEDLYQEFTKWLGFEEATNWTKNKFVKAVPQDIPKGRVSQCGDLCMYYGNITTEENAIPGPRWIGSGKPNSYMRRDIS